MKNHSHSKAAALFVRIVGYLAAIGFCLALALYMSASAGWTFIYVLAAAPIFSFIITFVTYITKSVSVETDISSSAVYKNEAAVLKIKVKNKSILPVPSVIVKLKECEGFVPENGGSFYVVSVSPKSITELEVPFKAKMWGADLLGAKEITLSDFLHFVTFSIYKEKGLEKYCHTVKVFPNIPDISSDAPIIRSTVEAIRFADDSEDTKESESAAIFGGMPGYSYREYYEGDPLKRINWKLSSKRNVYMVRLDDEVEAMQQIIVLDSIGGRRISEERAVEGMLAFVSALFRSGYESTVWFNTKNGFAPFEISELGDIYALQLSLSDYSFSESAEIRIPAEQISESKHTSGIILFTPYVDPKLNRETEEVKSLGITVTTVTAEVSENISSPCHMIGEEYDFEELSDN